VRHAVTVGVEQIGAGGAIARQPLPVARLVAVVPLQPQRLVDGHAQGVGFHTERVIRLGERPGRAAKAAQIVTRAAFPRYVFGRRDAPGSVQRQLAFTLEQHAEQSIFQHIQTQGVLPVDQQFQVVGRLRV